MSGRPRARRGQPSSVGVRAAAAAALLTGPLAAVGVTPASPAAAAAGDPPSLRVFSTASRVVAERFGRSAYVRLPIVVQPVGGTFELRVSRPDYASPTRVDQVVRAPDGTTTLRPTGLRPKSWAGLPAFFRVRVTGADGSVVRNSSRRFCPNSFLPQRIDPDGVDRPTFPEGCHGMPFSLGSVWGIDEGWAVPADGDLGFVLRVPDGRYTVSLTVRPKYAETFGIAPEDATASAVVRVRKGGRGSVVGRDAGDSRELPRLPEVPTRAVPPTDQLPDLRAVPAFAIDVRHQRRSGRDLLQFAANVWVGGTSRLDIEGFRRPGRPVMDAYQYFYEGDRVVARAPAGTMEFDRRRGHHHWHLEQFARYRLLDASRTHVVTSRKQSFCIVPTDPIDLSFDEAERRPFLTGLDSACGDGQALWIRETLPLGWGDTYFQSRAGQSFNITDVPNGRYFVEVVANPTGQLFESDTTNNVSLREVVLKGRPGHRRVCVPAVGSVDGGNGCA